MSDPPAPHQTRSRGDEPRTTCVIAGGGPAGLVLALLLARADIEVTVLEKHADFLRDFRGDTVHPSTLGLLEDLGLFEQFAALPQSQISAVRLPTPDGEEVTLADFTRLPLRHPYIAMVPQWDLLTLLADADADAASDQPTFTLRTEHEVTGVVRDGDRVTGVDYTSPAGDGRVLADLTVACDGRWSAVRRALDLPVTHLPVGFDAWWFRVPTDRGVGQGLLPRIAPGRVTVVIPRSGYFQVARLGRKGTDATVRARGIEAFRAELAGAVPELAGDVDGIESMDDVKHLDVRMDRLRRWHAPGCCASATPPTPCPRSAGWASTSRCRTPSRPPGSSPHPWDGVGCEGPTRSGSSPGSAADGRCRRS